MTLLSSSKNSGILNQTIDLASLFVTLLSYGATSLLAGVPLTMAISGTSMVTRPTLETAVSVSYVLGAIILAAIVWALSRASPRNRDRLLGILLLIGGSYAIISVGRVNIVTNNLDWSVARVAVTPRYQYFSQAGIAIALSLAFFEITRRRPQARRLGEVALALWIFVSIPITAAFTWESQPPGRAAFISFERAVAELKRTIRDAPEERQLVIPNHPLKPFNLPPQQFPNRAAVFVIAYSENTVGGRAIFFREEDEKLLATLRAGKKGRIQNVLIGIEDCPGYPIGGSVGSPGSADRDRDPRRHSPSVRPCRAAGANSSQQRSVEGP